MFCLKCLTLCLVFVESSFGAQIGEPCVIPNQNAIGRCIPKRNCAEYLSLVLSRDSQRFIRALYCETTPRSHNVKTICCPTDGNIYEDPVIPNRKLAEIADIDEFPWSALLIYNSTRKYVCGGALISNRFVLTAAHCLIGREFDADRVVKSVRLGEYNTETDVDCIILTDNLKECADPAIEMPVDEIIIHENYQPDLKSKRNDIALIRFAEDVEFSQFIKPILLPNDEIKSEFLIGSQHVIAGWGKTVMFYQTHGVIRTPIKLKMKIPIADFDSCNATYSSYNVHLDTNQLCAGGYQRYECLREGGYPLMFYNRKHNAWVISGITSLGLSKCYVAGVPDVYTNVENYVDWIQSKLN